MCITPRSQNFGLCKTTLILHIFSFMIYVFTLKSIYPYCPFKSNRRPANFQFWLRGVQFDYTVWARNPTLRWDAHRRVFYIDILFSWLCNAMHTAESDSAVWCTLWRLTPHYDAHHRVSLKILLSQRNRKRIRKYFSPFIRDPGGFESEKSGGQKSRDTFSL